VPCLSHVLIVLGGGLQIAGVAWAVVEVGKIRRSLVALRKAGQEIAKEIRSILDASPPGRDIRVAVHDSFTLTDSATVEKIPAAGPTLEQRVELLEAEIRSLAQQATDARQQAHSEARRTRELIDAQEKQRRESQASAERLQRRIAPLLVIGLALSVVGSVVPC